MPKTPKYLDVAESTALSVEQINGLITEGYTHYRFPDGTCPRVLPIRGWKCEGIKLIYHVDMGQFMWIGLMASDWAPINPHPT